MKAANIQDDHHFVKFCKQKDLIRENGKPIGLQPWAFALRKPTQLHPEQEKTASGMYYEFFDGTGDERMCACFHFIDMEIKRKDALVRLEVGSIKAQGEKRSRSLRVRHEPLPGCLGYAALHGLPVDTDDELCALLANEPVKELFEVAVLF
jgi:hypothetical protein